MTETFVMELGRSAFSMMLTLSLPLLATSLVVGLAIGLVQAVTQINEVTLTFVPKILAVLLVTGLLSAWMLQHMVTFTTAIFNLIGRAGM